MPYRKYLNSFYCHFTVWAFVISFGTASAVAQETGGKIAQETLRKINAIEIDTTAEDLKDTTTCPHCNRTVADAVVASKYWSRIQSACQKEFLIGFEAAKKNNEPEGFASA